MTNKPKILYKYHKINTNLNKLIRDNTLWFSNKKALNECNDSFDLEFDITDRFAEEISTEYSFLPTDIDKKLIAVKERVKKMDMYGICCFTDCNISEYMWTHYSTNLGVCIGFDSSYLDRVFKVDYSNDKIIIDSYKEIRKAVFTKGLTYKVEQEWRSVTAGYFGAVQFDKRAIVKITFGRLVTDETCKRIIKKFRRKGYEFKPFKIIANERKLLEIEYII